MCLNQMKLDSIDAAILKQLLADGRASLRDIAKKTSLSTPTVSSHFYRMIKAGLITKFVPVINLNETELHGILALVNLKVQGSPHPPPSAFSSSFPSIDAVARRLARVKEICSVFVTTGESKLVLKVIARNSEQLHRFLSGSFLRRLGVEVISTQIIIKTVKDEFPSHLLAEGTPIKLRCDFCKGDIATSRPYTILSASSHYYFCCKTCKRSYLERYGERIKARKGSNNKIRL
jgi:DNA-binding Lrp family transcriptional regulator